MEKSHFLQRFLMGGAFAVITIWGMFNVFVTNSYRLSAVDESGAIGSGVDACEDTENGSKEETTDEENADDNSETSNAGEETESDSDEDSTVSDPDEGEADDDSENDDTEITDEKTEETDKEDAGTEKPDEETDESDKNETGKEENPDCEDDETEQPDTNDEEKPGEGDEDETGADDETESGDKPEEDKPTEDEPSEDEPSEDESNEDDNPEQDPDESEKVPVVQTPSADFEQEKPSMDVVTVIAAVTSKQPSAEEKPVAESTAEETVSVIAVANTRVANEVSEEALPTQDITADNGDVIDGATFDGVDDPTIVEEHDAITNEDKDDNSPVPHVVAAVVAVVVVGGAVFLWVRQK